MAIIMKSSIKITKGFDTWQAMVKTQEERMKKMVDEAEKVGEEDKRNAAKIEGRNRLE